MKKLVSLFPLFFVVVISLFSLSSCEADDEMQPGIIYTDFPPESLFTDNNYAISYRCWVDVDGLSKIKERGEACNWHTNQDGEQFSSDCGMWRSLPARKYWGIINGIIYLSQSQEWYTVSPNTYLEIFEIVQKRGTVIAYTCIGCNTPFGDTPTITGSN